MKTKAILPILAAFVLSIVQQTSAQQVKITGNWGKQGITKNIDNLSETSFNYSLTEFSFNDVTVNGQLMHSVNVPGVFLPNREGAPDLPVWSKYIAVPDGATATVKILSSRTEVLHNVLVAPAPAIPLDTDDKPLVYQKDKSIYNQSAFYPANPVSLSSKSELRGISVVELSVVPFQYNPLTKELVVYKDMIIQVKFEGGTGNVGNQRQRSRFWDPLINSEIINNDIIPQVEYDNRKEVDSKGGECEYLIISPDNSDFLAWADSIKTFRTLQGIRTNVVTTSEIGGNTVSTIENYIDNAYNNWSINPAAVLLLGDFDSLPGSTAGIASQMYTHPAGYPNFASDNKYADVNGDELPDVVVARIPAATSAQLRVMVTKFLDYERKPPTDAAFYNNPVTALGWQTTRWFQLCSEVVGGFMKKNLGKNPVRVNALYSGAPETDAWSTASNTSTLLGYFGPTGLNYLTATPQETGGFTGGTGAQIASAINTGSFLVVHRDHGYYGGWGEPSFTTTTIGTLTNVNNKLPFIFSINCQTGAFHRSTESFAEKFIRYTYNGQNSGALGVIAAAEVSYSFVNDTYLWGVFDNMWPNFMPDKTSTFPMSYVMPAFANAAGKYFLSQSGWVGSSSKVVTYRLFHHFGDAFSTLYTEVPQQLTVAQPGTLQSGATSFVMSANAGSIIALVADGNILATASATGSLQAIAIPPLSANTVLNITVTKQNYFRYSAKVIVGAASGTPLSADFTGTPNTLTTGSTVSFTDLSAGNATSWSWSFPGGTPSSSTARNPVITYPSTGTFDVTLTSFNGTESSTKKKASYISVISPSVVTAFSANKTSILPGETVSFSDLSSNLPTSWNWSFQGGTPSTSTLQNPVVTYSTAGTYSVTLTAKNSSGGTTLTRNAYITVAMAAPVASFTSDGTKILTNGTVNFTDQSTGSPTAWNWSFPGGSPSASSLQNPSVSYPTDGVYDVTLTVANAGGTNTIIQSGLITVWNGVATYCPSNSVSSQLEWIAQVTFGSSLLNSGAATYTNKTAQILTALPGSTVPVSLIPGFNGKSRKEYWKIWIDFNQDGDFDDSGEALLSGSSPKGSLSGKILIPLSASGQTRMRISMKYNALPLPCEVFDRGEVEDYTVSFSADAIAPESATGQPVVKIFPNPVVNFMHIETSAEQAKGYIYSMSGSKLMQFVAGPSEVISLGDLPKGIYFLRLIIDGKIYNEKIVKQ